MDKDEIKIDTEEADSESVDDNDNEDDDRMSVHYEQVTKSVYVTQEREADA